VNGGSIPAGLGSEGGGLRAGLRDDEFRGSCHTGQFRRCEMTHILTQNLVFERGGEPAGLSGESGGDRAGLRDEEEVFEHDHRPLSCLDRI